MNIRTPVAVFLGTSVLIHAAFLSAMAVPDNTLPAASPPPALVSQGNSFADMAQRSSPETVQPPPVTTLTPTEVETVETGVQLQANELSEKPAEILATATTPNIATIAPVTPTQAATIQSVQIETVQPEVMEALPDVQVSEATISTLRPVQRPTNLGQTPPPRPSPEQVPVSQQGNANQNARQGQAAASQNTGQATQSSQGQQIDEAAIAAAREAAANYGNAVMRQISRTRRERTRSRGTAVVNFRVGTSGQLSSVAIGQSSGDVDLDRIAVNHVRRAAPFPAPPAGAQTSFSIQFQGR
jgi:protein TonB